MRFSKEKIRELKEKIRLELVQKPNVSIYELQGILGRDYKHRFDKNFIAKLKKQIHDERGLANRQNISAALSHLEDVVNEANKMLWEIIDDEKSSASTVIRAAKEIIWMYSKLFYIKLDAGAFEKPRERISGSSKLTPEKKAEMGRIIIGISKIYKRRLQQDFENQEKQ